MMVHGRWSVEMGIRDWGLELMKDEVHGRWFMVYGKEIGDWGL
jgi:hypothetical protein